MDLFFIAELVYISLYLKWNRYKIFDESENESSNTV